MVREWFTISRYFYESERSYRHKEWFPHPSLLALIRVEKIKSICHTLLESITLVNLERLTDPTQERLKLCFILILSLLLAVSTVFTTVCTH